MLDHGSIQTVAHTPRVVPYPPTRQASMIRAHQLHKLYRMGDSVVNALDGVDLAIAPGEFVSITGSSGSGKSTLMHILGCLDRPTTGTLEFLGEPIANLNEKKLARLRNQHIGFVFQTFNLINRTSALDNVVVPLVYTRKAFARSSALKALERVGLAHRAKHRPGEMSGGECQRVAIARAIVNSPRLILADEPTGNLDSRTGQQIMNIFHQLHAEGITIVLVTHELDVAVQASRIIQMRDGRIVNDAPVRASYRAEVLQASQDAMGRAFSSRAEEPV
ncbi:MAG: ABC transporter ATP-binding protein, partial [Planctomycetota bacterium]